MYRRMGECFRSPEGPFHLSCSFMPCQCVTDNELRNISLYLRLARCSYSIWIIVIVCRYTNAVENVVTIT